jgi:tetratricopeptide (TPR) repeat protein
MKDATRVLQRTWLLGALVFAVALAVRVVYLLDIRTNPFFTTPVIDAEYYHQTAQALATSGVGRAPFQMPPGYPLLLSLLYRIFGMSFLAAHLLQICLGATSAALTFAIARRVARTATGGSRSDGVGLLAAGFVATSKALLYLEGDLLATPLAVALDLLVLFFLVRWVQDGMRRRDLGLAAIALGLSALVVPLVLATVPLLAVWIGARRRRPWVALAWLGLVALPILPVTVRNWRASGEFVPVSANGGINFWMGNNPDARRTASTRPGPEWRAMQELPLRAGKVLASSARDRWFWQEGARFWLQRPGRAVLQTAEKVLLLLHNHEAMRDFDFYYFRDHFSWVLRAPGWNFAILFSLAVLGFGWARSRAAADTLLLVYLASSAAALTLFFVTGRYRAPLLPVLAVYAAEGVAWIASRVRVRAWRQLRVPALAGAAVFVLSSVDFVGADRVDAVEAEYRVATTYEKRGQLPDAILRYDAVLARDPGHALAAARAGVCSQRLGRMQEAIDRYEALLERHPDYAEAAVNLANIAWQHGNNDEAEHYFQVALQADPFLAQAHASYGLFHLQRRDAPGAVAAIAEALAYDPTWDALRLDYVRALLAAGDTRAALVEIDRAGRLLPENGQIELLRGDVFKAAGSAQRARAAWERGLQLDPANGELRRRLAALAIP